MAFSVWFFSLEYFICNYGNDLLIKLLLLLGFATDIASLVMMWSQNSIPLWMWSQNTPLAVHVHTYSLWSQISMHILQCSKTNQHGAAFVMHLQHCLGLLQLCHTHN